jgi:hypothetical protein
MAIVQYVALEIQVWKWQTRVRLYDTYEAIQMRKSIREKEQEKTENDGHHKND